MVHSLSDLIVFENSQGVRARGNLVKVSRSTLIFEVYNPYSIVQLSEVLHHVEIRSDDRVIYRGRAVVSGLVNTGLMLIVSANPLDAWSELAGLAGDSQTIRGKIADFVADWQSHQQLQPDYQLSVSRLRSFLSATNRWLEHLDFYGADRAEVATGLNDELFPDLVRELVPPLLNLLQEFEYQASIVDEESRTTHIRYAQDDLHPLIMRAPFVHRAYHKPLGYAGDYEMVNMMLRDAREGPTVYAQLINTLYLKTGPAQAHRNRIDILVDWLKRRIEGQRNVEAEQQLRILNVGCGPAIEMQRLIRRYRAIEHCDITLVDFSQETLDYTRECLETASQESGTTPAIRYLHQSVHGLLKQASSQRRSASDTALEPGFDLIYCAGLFDYLSDRVCARLLGLFHELCVPGGQVLVTNVHPSNPSRHGMEHLLEWYLVYRDEAGMRKLGRVFKDYDVFADETGVNVFLTIDKANEPAR
ncbi:s-adenosyl-l-methionine-dependent methyltransferase [Salinisphaera sp. T31B1]